MGGKVCLRCKGKTLPGIVENYYISKTVEQKAMFTLYKVTVKLMYTLYNNLTNFSKQIVKSA